MNDYDDIINLERPSLPFEAKALMSTRAAQFAPFSALAGYYEALEEIRRVTTKKRSLTESSKKIINEKLKVIKNNIWSLPNVCISYFVEDKKKEGGEYKKITGKVRRIDEANKKIILITGEHIFIEDIDDITGEIFNDLKI